MSRFSVQKIASHVADNPLLHPNRYEVIITGPVDIKQNILMNCNRCNIPGHTTGSFEHSVIGPKRKIPNEELFDDLTMSFYLNKYIEEANIFHRWIRMVGGDSSFRMAYYNDIVGQVQLNIYDLTDKLTANVVFYEAYPNGMSDIEFGYDTQEPIEVTINWSYHSYEIKSSR